MLLRRLLKYFLIIAACIALNLTAYAQPISFDFSKIKCKSESDCKLLANVPQASRNVLQGLAPAPTLSAEQQKDLKQFAFRSLVRTYGIEENSPEWKYHQQRFLGDGKIEPVALPSQKAPLEHHRFKGGKPVPSKEDIEQQIAKKIQKAKSKKRIKKKRRIRLDKNTNSQNSTKSPKIKKPVCNQSITTKLTIPEDFLADKQVLDLLFINGSAPFNTSVSIGKATYLISFDDESMAEEASMYGNLSISCVPFRIRSDGKQVTYSQGIEALKNYDANPESNGTLDPTIKKYIEQLGLK